MSTVGFNLDKASDLHRRLGFCYNSCLEALAGMVHVVSEELYGEYSVWRGEKPTTNHWYAPEAVEFEKNIFEPMIMDLYKEINRTYRDLNDSLKSAVDEWCNTTGTTKYGYFEMPSADVTIDSSDFDRAKSTDAAGNVFISIDLPERIRAKKQGHAFAYSNAIYDAKEEIDLLKTECAFLGASQQDNWSSNVDRIYNSLVKKFDELIDTSANEVQKYIDKYITTAKKVASSFGGSSTIGSTGSTASKVNKVN